MPDVLPPRFHMHPSLWGPIPQDEVDEVRRIRALKTAIPGCLVLHRENEIEVLNCAPGVGDVVAYAYTVAGVRAEYPKARIVWTVPDSMKDWARLFTDADELRTAPKIPVAGCEEYQNVFEDVINRRGYRFEVDALYNGVKAERPKMVRVPRFDFQARWGLKVPPVIIAAQSNAINRTYPLAGWWEVAKAIEEAGIPCVFVGRNLPAELPRTFEAGSPLELCSILSSGLLTLGNDSAPPHLCGVMGAPAIAVLAIEVGWHVYGGYGCVDTIQAPKWCTGCMYQPERGFERQCKQICFALEAIEPKMISDRVLKLIGAPGFFSLIHPNAHNFPA